jgi:hypothetical protein
MSRRVLEDPSTSVTREGIEEAGIEEAVIPVDVSIEGGRDSEIKGTILEESATSVESRAVGGSRQECGTTSAPYNSSSPESAGLIPVVAAVLQSEAASDACICLATMGSSWLQRIRRRSRIGAMATDEWHIRGPSRDTGSKTGRRGRDRGGKMSATGALLRTRRTTRSCINQREYGHGIDMNNIRRNVRAIISVVLVHGLDKRDARRWRNSMIDPPHSVSIGCSGGMSGPSSASSSSTVLTMGTLDTGGTA